MLVSALNAASRDSKNAVLEAVNCTVTGNMIDYLSKYARKDVTYQSMISDGWRRTLLSLRRQ